MFRKIKEQWVNMDKFLVTLFNSNNCCSYNIGYTIGCYSKNSIFGCWSDNIYGNIK